MSRAGRLRVTAFPAIEGLLAHRPPMLLIERVLSMSECRVVVGARPDPLAWYADEHGNMPAWVGIELMAQAIAAWANLRAEGRGNRPRMGLFLGTREYRCSVPVFPPGRALQISATSLVQDAGGLSAFSCTIEMDTHVLAEGALKVFEPSDFAAFIEGQR